VSDAYLTAAAAAVVVLAAVLAALLARRYLMLITVRGRSMAPAYQDGDRLVIVRRGSCAVGDVITFRAPGSLPMGVRWLVKRAAAIAGDPVPADFANSVSGTVVPEGRLLVRSDAAEGLDSRQLGFIDVRDVAGVVRRRLTAAAQLRR
jgi:signal peptidase I